MYFNANIGNIICNIAIIYYKFANSNLNLMFMKNIYTLGESLIDIIFECDKVKDAIPGGSMLNTAISLGRMGLDIHHITELGNDSGGNLIEQFLKTNHVKNDNITKYKNHQTALALAFLDANNNANYTFYKRNPRKRILKCPDFKKDDILLFGSIYSITKELREPILNILNEAKKAGDIIVYDPNIRKNHLKDLKKFKQFIDENINYATIVKASDEDVENIYSTKDFNEIYNLIKKAGCNNLIITENKNGVNLFTPIITKHYDVPKIRPVSTIGAGDSFNAGIIFAINYLALADINNINIPFRDKIIETGIAFATDVCLRYENYISDTIKTNY